jgi:ATP-dependent Clp protease ATP-binding subunit ClpB
MEKHSVARLIGAPPGYIGYEEGGFLTESVRRRPYSVILLDEIEKAHPDVFNILLQVLDDGRLTDGHGRTVDFRNTVLVMTSNLGSDLIQTMPDSGYDEMKSAVMNVVTTAFRPEFINRVDDAVVFHSLGKEQIKRIAHIQLEILQRRVNEARIDLQFDEDSLAFLVEAGYDPVYGARPLKRAIQQYVENPLAEAILSGDYVGGDQIRASTADKSIVFAKS